MSERLPVDLVPCARCGAPVDAARAPFVVVGEDTSAPHTMSSHALCSLVCRDAFVVEPDVPPTPEPPRSVRPASATGSWKSSATPVRRKPAAWTGEHTVEPLPIAPPPTVALGLAMAGVVAAAFAQSPSVAFISGVCVLASGASALAGGAHLRETAGWVAYVAGPLAVALAVVSSLLTMSDGGDPRLPLVGAAFVAALANVRWWLDARTEAPVQRLELNVRRCVPTTVRVVRAEGVEVVPAERVRVGEEVDVEAGEVVGVDGVIRRGTAVLALHPSAEEPERRAVGDSVIAGARVVEGRVRILATRVGADRALLRPFRFGDATASDAARLTRVAAQLLALAGGLAAVGVVLGAVLASPEGGLSARLAASAAVLIAVPALSLRRASSTPFATGALVAARRGITFASARAMERAAVTTTAVFATHGTLTEGIPEVVEAHGDLAVLPLVAAVEADVTHPTASALRAHARLESHALPAVRKVALVPGRGVRASGPGGELVLVGSRQLLLDDGTSVASLEEEAQRAEARGLSVVFVGVDGRARAWFGLRDEVRPGARAAVQRLIDLDVDVQLISGDHRATVEALARVVDVEHSKAELIPDERVTEVRRLHEVGGRVAVVGHPARDAEVLAVSDTPVQLNAAGGPEAERGIALTTDDLRDASAALWIARAASRDAMRASLIAVAAGAVLVTVGAFGLFAPGVVAIFALVVDVVALPTPARVLQRIEHRLPVRS